jgi:hypothetical protein
MYVVGRHLRAISAHLLLFTGLRPTDEGVSALRAVVRSVAALGSHMRVHYVFPSQAYATAARFTEDDRRVLVDGLEKIHALFGIRQPEIVYIRPDGYIGFRSQTPHNPTLQEYLRRIDANDLLHAEPFENVV